MDKFLNFFIETKNKLDNESQKKARLFVLLILISILASWFGASDKLVFSDQVIFGLRYLTIFSILLLFLSKFWGNLKALGNLYSFVTWSGISIIIYFSGGVMSAAYQWLLVSIIPAYIFTSKKNGHFWFFLNFFTALIFAFLSKFGLIGLMTEISDMELMTNASFGLLLLIFVPLLVIFYSKTNEEIKGELKNLNFDLIEQEKQAKISEEKFRVIAENFPNGSIVIISDDFQVLTCYGDLIDKNQLSPEAELNTNLSKLLGEEEFNKRLPYYQKALNGEISTFESHYNNQFYLNSAAPLRENDGRIKKFMVASQIITDLKNFENELIESKELLRLIIDTIPFSIVHLDKSANFITVNKFFADLMNLKVEDICGKNIKETFNLQMLAEFSKNLEIAKTEGKFSNTFRLKDLYSEKMNYYYFILTSINDKNNENQGFVSVTIDVSQQREIEHKLLEKNQEIDESIEYAQRIQKGVFGDFNNLNTMFKNSFVYFNPREKLSGDFFWCGIWNDKKIVIAADCTGHGVPGALMTILGITFLNEIVYTYGMDKPDMILHQLDQKITETLIKRNSTDKIQDGLDASVIVIDEKENKLYFSGAKNPILICNTNNECIRIKGSKYPIGSTHYKDKIFDVNEINLKVGDIIYLFSDGFQDQMGGYNGKKYMAPNFRNLLETISVFDVEKQKELLGKSFDEWKFDRDQTDDVLVVGIKYELC